MKDKITTIIITTTSVFLYKTFIFLDSSLLDNYVFFTLMLFFIIMFNIGIIVLVNKTNNKSKKIKSFDDEYLK
jgi:uncharacterized membrane protein